MAKERPPRDMISASRDEWPVLSDDKDVLLGAKIRDLLVSGERPVRAGQAAQAAEPTKQDDKRRGARAAGATVTVRLTTRVGSKLLDGLTDAVVPFTEGTMSLEVRTDDLEALPPGLRRRAGTSDNGWTSLG